MGHNSEEQLMLFAEDSPAKTSVQQENKQDLTEKEALCTFRCLELFVNQGQNSQYLKTSRDFSLVEREGGSVSSSMIWPKSGTMRNGTVYPGKILEPAIGGIGSGLLPTPTCSDSKGSPRKRWYKNEFYKSNLCEALRDGPEDKIYPHPELVEQMMGFPIGWTDLDD